MDRRDQDVFHGRVVSGEMAGHTIRVDAGRATRSAARGYTIVYRSAQMPGQSIVGYVADRTQLKGYFRDLRLEVEWVGERSPLDPPATPSRPRRTTRGRWRRARRKIARHKRTRLNLSRRPPQADDTPLWTLTPLPHGLSDDEMVDIITSSIRDMMHAGNSETGR